MTTGARDVGLFVSHLASDRIERHFSRLCQESEALIDWHRLEAGKTAGTVSGLSPVPAGQCMHSRASQMEKNGGVRGGYLDTLVIPFVLATHASYVWIIEYDVDFSGQWSELFGQFRRDSTDFLATTLFPQSETPDWAHWRTARAPAAVPNGLRYRSFAPIMRVSHRFASHYAHAVAAPGWDGHYEFTLPTVALWSGHTVGDLGGLGPLCTKERLGRNYSNSPRHPYLIPGTFVWRPNLTSYFHERPNIFGLNNMLHHPVKPEMAT